MGARGKGEWRVGRRTSVFLSAIKINFLKIKHMNPSKKVRNYMLVLLLAMDYIAQML